MNTITLTLTDMANGGAALGRDDTDRVIFVPLAIPGEVVEVEITEDKKRFAQARLVQVVRAAPERTTPRCPHFGPCGGCHFQHINYPAQLSFKEAIIRDQLARIGGLSQVSLRPIIANPNPWNDDIEVTFSATDEGRAGFWSPSANEVILIEECHLIRPALIDLHRQIDLELPGLRRLSLRTNEDEALLAVLETDDMEPPALETDLTLSVALALPDGTAANLVGDSYLVQSVKGREFRVSAGCYFPPSPAVTGQLVDIVLRYAALTGAETLLELYSGVGTLTAFLAPLAASVTAIEVNEDAAADAAINLHDLDNVTLYVGLVEEILPLLDVYPETVVVDPPPTGLGPSIIASLTALAPRRLVYISSDIATLARDGRRLVEAGYRLVEIQPIDTYPQRYQVQTVSLWQVGG